MLWRDMELRQLLEEIERKLQDLDPRLRATVEREVVARLRRKEFRIVNGRDTYAPIRKLIIGLAVAAMLSASVPYAPFAEYYLTKKRAADLQFEFLKPPRPPIFTRTA